MFLAGGRAECTSRTPRPRTSYRRRFASAEKFTRVRALRRWNCVLLLFSAKTLRALTWWGPPMARRPRWHALTCRESREAIFRATCIRGRGRLGNNPIISRVGCARRNDLGMEIIAWGHWSQSRDNLIIFQNEAGAARSRPSWILLHISLPRNANGNLTNNQN